MWGMLTLPLRSCRKCGISPATDTLVQDALLVISQRSLATVDCCEGTICSTSADVPSCAGAVRHPAHAVAIDKCSGDEDEWKQGLEKPDASASLLEELHGRLVAEGVDVRGTIDDPVVLLERLCVSKMRKGDVADVGMHITASVPASDKARFQELLQTLLERLHKQGLQLSDLPHESDPEFSTVLAELGFQSVLDRTKLRRAVRELSTTGTSSISTVEPGQSWLQETTVEERTTCDMDDFVSEASDFVPMLGAYYSGERVDFLSGDGSWEPAEVAVEAFKANQEEATYRVKLLHRDEEHRNVGMCSLRSPLIAGEPCEAWCEGSGRWLPAVVCTSKSSSRSVYAVQVLEKGADGQVVQDLSPAAVRRRFPPGAAVDVYCGTAFGWQSATIVSGLAQLARGSRSISSPSSSSQRGSAGSRFGSSETTESDSRTLVWVSLDGQEGEECLQQVPAGFIRLHPETPDATTVDIRAADQVARAVAATPRPACGRNSGGRQQRNLRLRGTREGATHRLRRLPWRLVMASSKGATASACDSL